MLLKELDTATQLQVVEKETNYTWQFGSGKPLYRLVVLRFRPWIRFRSWISTPFGIKATTILILNPDPGFRWSGSTLDPDPPWIGSAMDSFWLTLNEITLLSLQKRADSYGGSDSSRDPDPGNSNSGSLGYDSGSRSTKKRNRNTSTTGAPCSARSAAISSTTSTTTPRRTAPGTNCIR